MNWPPPGAMGPIFGEYLFVRFFARPGEACNDGYTWPDAKMGELLMQLRHVVEPDGKLVTPSKLLLILLTAGLIASPDSLQMNLCTRGNEFKTYN